MKSPNMDKMRIWSDEWFDSAFLSINVPGWTKEATVKIICDYNIKGQADPGYIANVIMAAFNKHIESNEM